MDVCRVAGLNPNPDIGISPVASPTPSPVRTLILSLLSSLPKSAHTSQSKPEDPAVNDKTNRATYEDLLEYQHLNSTRLKILGTQVSEITTTLEYLIEEEELSLQPIFYSEETVDVATLTSVELDEFLIVDEYLSEPDETLEVTSHEPYIDIA
ncbi:hypothetical protein Sjap_021639 [Stephania japonica]|uniref:Uncharacterized protein n=2 Tax=Stephania japonica TaxID=461633 RepID=A0AAP0EQH6_9MAGN